jgi:hypothetical protein
MVDASSNPFVREGDKFRAEGDKKRKGSTFGNIFFNSKADRDRQALDYYQKAANCYKSANLKDLAVECLMLCVECETEASCKATLLFDAAKIIKSANSAKYHQLITQAIQMY